MLFSRIEAGPIISTAKSNPQMEYFEGAFSLKPSRLLLERFWYNPLSFIWDLDGRFVGWQGVLNPRCSCLEDIGKIPSCACQEARESA